MPDARGRSSADAGSVRGGHPTVRGFFRGWQEGETCILCGVDREDYLRSTARAAQREPGVST